MGPLIKWTGSKRSLAPSIIKKFPENIKTYWEPFLGGGSVFLELLKSHIRVEKFRLSDVNEPLIKIFQAVQISPDELIEHYKENWELLQKNPDHYYEVRTRFNEKFDPYDFYFLTRTCYCGMVRFNSKGEYNVGFHFGRKGMNPLQVSKVLRHYHDSFKGKDIEFQVKSFEEITETATDDVVFLDPPYTHSNSLYYGSIDIGSLEQWIQKTNGTWFLTMNGLNKRDNQIPIQLPKHQKVLLNSGKSSFSNLKGEEVAVSEYFYYKEVQSD